VSRVRPFEELPSSGLLWLINSVVFHPRGYALGLHRVDGKITGWCLLGDGTEAWRFEDEDIDALFSAAEQTLREAREAPGA
jgi:hypothetical protein